MCRRHRHKDLRFCDIPLRSRPLSGDERQGQVAGARGVRWSAAHAPPTLLLVREERAFMVSPTTTRSRRIRCDGAVVRNPRGLLWNRTLHRAGPATTPVERRRGAVPHGPNYVYPCQQDAGTGHPGRGHVGQDHDRRDRSGRTRGRGPVKPRQAGTQNRVPE